MHMARLLGIGLAAALILAVDVAFLSSAWDSSPIGATTSKTAVITLADEAASDAAVETALEVPAGPHVASFDRSANAREPGRMAPSARGRNPAVTTARADVEAALPSPTTTESISTGVPTNPHTLAGNQQTCMNCHAKGAIAPLPATHAGQTAETCLSCHVAPTVPPPPMPHEANGRWSCLSCHVAGKQGALPASHKARREASCVACHPVGAAVRQREP
jgi:hypothetical protein